MTTPNTQPTTDEVARELWLVGIAAAQPAELLEHYANNIWPDIQGEVRADYMRLAQHVITHSAKLREENEVSYRVMKLQSKTIQELRTQNELLQSQNAVLVKALYEVQKHIHLVYPNDTPIIQDIGTTLVTLVLTPNLCERVRELEKLLIRAKETIKHDPFTVAGMLCIREIEKTLNQKAE